MVAQCHQLAECSAVKLKMGPILKSCRNLRQNFSRCFLVTIHIFMSAICGFSSADGFFFSLAAELLSRAGRKIQHCHGTVLLKNSVAGKKISAAFKKVPKNEVFCWNTGILLHVKAMLGTPLVWILTLQNH
jgi:hypothetical protein